MDHVTGRHGILAVQPVAPPAGRRRRRPPHRPAGRRRCRARTSTTQAHRAAGSAVCRTGPVQRCTPGHEVGVQAHEVVQDRRDELLAAHPRHAAQPQRGRGVDRQLLAALVDVDADARRPPRPGAARTARRRPCASRRSATSTSLGHFSACLHAGHLRDRARLHGQSGEQRHPRGAVIRRRGSSTETATEAVPGASHARPRRPRPACWWSATTTRHGRRALRGPRRSWSRARSKTSTAPPRRAGRDRSPRAERSGIDASRARGQG